MRAGLRFGVRRRHLLEPALAVLALVPHPARVAEAGGVDTAAREAGAGPLARLGLGHLRVERQVEEAIAQQPVVPVQQPGGGAPAAAAAARRPSPPEPRGRWLRGASAGRAPRLHLPQRPCPAGLRSRTRTGMLLGGNPAGENRAPAATASAPLHRRLPQSHSPVRRDRSPPRSPPLGSLQSHSGIASRYPDLVSSAGRAHRRGAPGPAGGGERAEQATRGAPEGTCGRGPAGGGGDPGSGPASPAARANCLCSQPRAPGRAGASWSLEVGAPNAGGGSRKAGVSPAPPRTQPAAPQQPCSLPCR